jgi:hypothetical protein
LPVVEASSKLNNFVLIISFKSITPLIDSMILALGFNL